MKTIRSKKWYKPMEVARLGLIKNSTGGDNTLSNYLFILKLIKRGHLTAKNYSTTEHPYWLISEDEIAKYNEF